MEIEAKYFITSKLLVVHPIKNPLVLSLVVIFTFIFLFTKYFMIGKLPVEHAYKNAFYP